MNLFYFLFQSIADRLTSIKVRTDETTKKVDARGRNNKRMYLKHKNQVHLLLFSIVNSF